MAQRVHTKDISHTEDDAETPEKDIALVFCIERCRPPQNVIVSTVVIVITLKLLFACECKSAICAHLHT